MKRLLVLLLTLFALNSCEQDPEIINLDNTAEKKPEQITICHYNSGNDTWKTIQVSEKQLQKHLDHGDKRAPCGYTYVPDDEFENILISLGYDDVMDDYVLTSNINTVEELCIGAGAGCEPPTPNLCGDFYGCGIEDFTGLEDFSSLKELVIFNQNYFTILDLSKNTALESLLLSENYLHEILIVPESLISVWIGLNGYGPFKELDFSKCTNLTNLSLEILITDFLNLQNGNNKSLNPGCLFTAPTACVQVDDVAWMEENWGDCGFNPINFSEDCGH